MPILQLEWLYCIKELTIYGFHSLIYAVGKSFSKAISLRTYQPSLTLGNSTYSVSAVMLNRDEATPWG